MANQCYPLGRQYIQGGSWNPTTDTIKAALVKNTYTPTMATDQFLSDLGANRIGTDQTTAGKAITNGAFSANNVTFPAVPAGSTVSYLVLYKDTGVAGTSPLIVFYDTITGFPFASGGTDVTISWNASGIFRV